VAQPSCCWGNEKLWCQWKKTARPSWESKCPVKCFTGRVNHFTGNHFTGRANVFHSPSDNFTRPVNVFNPPVNFFYSPTMPTQIGKNGKVHTRLHNCRHTRRHTRPLNNLLGKVLAHKLTHKKFHKPTRYYAWPPTFFTQRVHSQHADQFNSEAVHLLRWASERKVHP